MPTSEGPLVAKIGSVTKGHPELRFTPKGTAVANFSIAVKPYVPKGQPPGETTFYEVAAFGTLAEHCAENLTKGDRVLVIGTGKVEEWNDKTTGEKRSKKIIVADGVGPDLRFCGVDIHRQARGSQRPPTTTYEADQEPF